MTDPITRELSEEAHIRLLMFPENARARSLVIEGDRAFRSGHVNTSRACYMQALALMPLPDPMRITMKDALGVFFLVLMAGIIVILVP